MTIMVFGSTELISCYGQYNKTKRRQVQALAGLQYPKPVDLGYGYRKITYKWNRLVRVYDTTKGIVRAGKIESIEKIPMWDFFTAITLDGIGNICLPGVTKVLGNGDKYVTLSEITCNDVIGIMNYHRHQTSRGRLPLVKGAIPIESTLQKEVPPLGKAVYKINLEDKGEGIGLILGNGLIVA